MGYQWNSLSSNFDIVNPSGTGTVTSVSFSGDGTVFDPSTQTVTTTGGFTPVLLSQAQNLVFASPNGTSGAPVWRALVAADLPSLSGTYLPLAGGTMSGAITMGSNQIHGLASPSTGQDAVNLSFMTTYTNALFLPLVGGTMSGAINMGAHQINNLLDPSSPQDAVTVAYLNAVVGVYLPLAGGLMNGTINMQGNTLIGLPTPVNPNDAVNLAYLSNYLPLAGSAKQIIFYSNAGSATSDANHTIDSVTGEVNLQWIPEPNVTSQMLLSGLVTPYGTLPGSWNVTSNSVTNDIAFTGSGDLSAIGGSTESVVIAHVNAATSDLAVVLVDNNGTPSVIMQTLLGASPANGLKYIQDNTQIAIQDNAAGGQWFLLDTANFLYQFGDINNSHQHTYLSIDDQLRTFTFNFDINHYTFPYGDATVAGQSMVSNAAGVMSWAGPFATVTALAAYLPLAGGTMLGELTLNPATQVAMNDAATIGQLVSFVSGLAWKSPAAQAAAVGNVNIASPASAVFDGHTVNPGESVLLLNQSALTENGIYIFNGIGVPMTRRVDSDTPAELTAATISVLNGPTYGGESFTQITDTPNIGVDPIIFAEIGIAYSASGLGIIITGNVFSLKLDTVNIIPTLGIDAGNGLYVPNGAITVNQLDATGITGGSYIAPTITVGVDGRIYSIVGSPGIVTSVSGLSGAISLATSTTGIDFTISTGGSTITFNMPSASATARGLVTNAAQTIAGIKSFTNGIVIQNDNTLTLNNTANTQSLGFKAPSGLASSVVYTLPAPPASPLQYLTSDASGVMSWGILSYISSINGDGTPGQTLVAHPAGSGTSFNIVNAGSGVHNFELPDASLTANGTVNLLAQDFLGQKGFNFTSTSALPGTVSPLTSTLIINPASGSNGGTYYGSQFIVNKTDGVSHTIETAYGISATINYNGAVATTSPAPIGVYSSLNFNGSETVNTPYGFVSDINSVGITTGGANFYARTNNVSLGTKYAFLVAAGNLAISQFSDVYIQNNHILRFINGAGNTISFQPPSSGVTNSLYTLPTAVPATTSVLSSSSGGVLSWTNVSTGFVTTFQTFSVQTNFTNVFTFTPSSPTSGPITQVWTVKSQNAHTVWAGPTSGGSAAPTFRTLVAGDLPTLLTGTAGTDFNIDITTPTQVTFNIPDASASPLRRGLVNVDDSGGGNGGQSFYGNKTFNKTVTDTSSSNQGPVYSNLLVNLPSNSFGNAKYQALVSIANINDPNDHSTDILTAGYFESVYSGTGGANLGTASGVVVYVTNNDATSTIGNMYGAQITVDNAAGGNVGPSEGLVINVTNYSNMGASVGVNVSLQNSSAGSISSMYGYQSSVTNAGGGSVSVGANFYASQSSGATTNYAFLVDPLNLAPSKFNDVIMQSGYGLRLFNSGNTNSTYLTYAGSANISLALPLVAPTAGQILGASSSTQTTWINAGGLTVGGTATGFGANEIAFIDPTGTSVSHDSSFTHQANVFTNITQINSSDITAYNQSTVQFLLAAEVSGTNFAQLQLHNLNGSHLTWASGSGTFGFVASNAGAQIQMGSSNFYTFPTSDGTAGQVLTTAGGFGGLSWTSPGGGGTVTSVGFTGDGVIFNSVVSGSPVTGAGTLAPSLLSQAANTFLAAPDGASGTPTFRAMLATDLPVNITSNTSGNAATATTAVNFSGALVGSVAGTQGATYIDQIGDGGVHTIAMNLTGSDAIGDMYYRNASGLLTRLPIGTNGFQLRVAAGIPTWQVATAGGTVTSVGLTQTGTVFTITGSPVTTAGNLNLAFASQTANFVFAAPNGAPGAPTFRALVAADIPATTLANSNIFVGSAGNVATAVAMSGAIHITNTGATTLFNATPVVLPVNTFVFTSATAGVLANTAVPAAGQMLIGTGAAPALVTLSGGITAVSAAGVVTLGGTPTFTNIIDSGLTANTFMISNAAKQLTSLAAATNGQIVVGVTGGPPALVTMSGGATISATGVVTLNAAPTFTSISAASITDTGLTAQSFIFSGVGGLLTSTASPAAGQLLIGAGAGIAPALHSLSGAIFGVTAAGVVTLGTSAAVITPANSFIFGSTTAGQLAAVTSASAGQLLVSTGVATAPALVTMSGGATISAAGVVTLAGSPSFTAVTAANVTDSALTVGGVVYAGAAGLLSNNAASFFWNNAAASLAIGTATTAANVTVVGTNTALPQMILREIAAQTADIADFQNSASTTIAKINAAGDVFAHHFMGLNTAAPTVAVQAGAGVGSTATITAGGNDSAMIVNLTVAALGTASVAIAIVTYNGTWTAAPKVIMTPANAVTARIPAINIPFVSGSSTTTFTITSNTTALPIGTYSWYAQSIG